jgi:hypothetical protein
VSRHAIIAAYRDYKRRWRRELEQVDLVLKGHEIRGWKQFSARRAKAQTGNDRQPDRPSNELTR